MEGSVVGGGENNYADGINSVVAGGGNNSTEYSFATVSGGSYNQAVGFDTTVCGGYDNIATNFGAIAVGGANNVAGGTGSFAAGEQAQALHQGAFVWSDTEAPAFASTGENQFLVRASGGVGIGTNHPAASLNVASSDGIGFPQMQLNQQADDYSRLRFVSYTNRYWDLAVESSMNFYVNGGPNGGNVLILESNGNASVAGTVMANGMLLTSDRNAKENFAALDSQSILDKVAALPLSEWDYKTEGPEKKHIGPMAQDFHAAFQLDGSDDKHISIVDESGVALAAIQGLNRKLEDEVKTKDSEIQKLQELNNALAGRLDQLEAAVKALAEKK